MASLSKYHLDTRAYAPLFSPVNWATDVSNRSAAGRSLASNREGLGSLENLGNIRQIWQCLCIYCGRIDLLTSNIISLIKLSTWHSIQIPVSQTFASKFPQLWATLRGADRSEGLAKPQKWGCKETSLGKNIWSGIKHLEPHFKKYSKKKAVLSRLFLPRSSKERNSFGQLMYSWVTIRTQLVTLKTWSQMARHLKTTWL